MAGRKIYTLEEYLQECSMECLLEELDISLEHVRRNKLTQKEHLKVLKSADKNLRKQSLTLHPDKAISEKKSDGEIANAQNLQVALNATRTVLKALTKVFLEDIDILYKYEFFSKMDISTLINEKELDRQINNVLCKISILSEVKRMNIVGEIRKFLQESRKSLRNFLDDDKDEFERHRDYALRYLHKCIEGYEAFAMECELVVKECRVEGDFSTRSAIQKIADQNQTGMEILRNLERVAEKSLDGNFQIFSIYKPVYRYDYYLISPFVLYINVMLMCTTVINRKFGYLTRFKNFFKSNTYISHHFDTKPELFLKAYHLASSFNDQHGSDVEIALGKKSLPRTNDNIICEFKDVVKSIGEFLEEEFNVKAYKEGKSNREQFAEKMSKLNESVPGHKELEKLQEELNLCKKDTDEIRKKCFEFSDKIQETEVQSRENILKCKNTSEEISKLISGCYQKKDTRSRNLHEVKAYENVSCNGMEKDTTETKLEKKLEKYETIAENLLEFLTDCRQNVSESTGSQSNFGSQNEYSLVITGEFVKKIKASYELNKKINEQLFYLMTQDPSRTTKLGNTKEKNLENSFDIFNDSSSSEQDANTPTQNAKND